jgi:hypothetical protein
MPKQPRKTETDLSLTPENKAGRPPRTSTAPVTWSIRGVETETRRVIEKAAERTGKTLGNYLNDDVRGFAQGQLTQTQLPASPKDIQNQIDHLTRIVEGISERLPEQGKRSFWKRLFG